jgi:hypothetical protein
MTLWEYTINVTALNAIRYGLMNMNNSNLLYFDIWNEPNAQRNVQCMIENSTCPFDSNLTQSSFFNIYDKAHQVLRLVAPNAKIVAPSLADGGPGQNGFATVFPWLQSFLLHAHHSNTLPDVLSWHVSMIESNTSLLETQHILLKEWAKEHGITLPPIAHNEILSPRTTLSPAVTLNYLIMLERLKVEHSCRACWVDPVTKASPCNDNTLDGLLTNDCLQNTSLGPNKGYKPACTPELKPRSVYYAHQFFHDLRDQNQIDMKIISSNVSEVSEVSNISNVSNETTCVGIDGIAVINDKDEKNNVVTVLLGRGYDSDSTNNIDSTNIDSTKIVIQSVDFQVFVGFLNESSQIFTVEIHQVVMSGRSASIGPIIVNKTNITLSEPGDILMFSLVMSANDIYKIIISPQ